MKTPTPRLLLVATLLAFGFLATVGIATTQSSTASTQESAFTVAKKKAAPKKGVGGKKNGVGAEKSAAKGANGQGPK